MSDLLEQRLAQLPPERRAALQKLLKQRTTAKAAPREIRRRPPGEPVPLSFAQQRLWFLQQMEPQSRAYNVAYALRLHGRLDVPALEWALTQVVRRHDSLRTRFPVVGEEPVQVIDPPAPVRLPHVELGLPCGERELERLAAEEARRPFDLARGPLLRTTLVRLDGDEWALLLSLHHIVIDGWSTGVLMRELSVLYEARSRGGDARLPELPVQYGDYAVWQREYLTGAVLDAQIAYWRARLEGAPPLLEIPTDRPRPAVPDGRGAGCRLALSVDETRALLELGRAEGATLFMVLLAAWQVLLMRYSGQEDVSVGTPIAGRSRVEVEGLIGFFINTVVLRSDLSGNPSFRELLAQVRQTALGAYAHQDVPFERLVEELRVERSLDRTPLYQTDLSLQTADRREMSLGDLRLELVTGRVETANTDLSLSWTLQGDRLYGLTTYRTELFDAPTVERLGAHLRVLLAEAAAGPERRVAELPLLTTEEERQVALEWNATAAPLPDGCIHELFAAQARRTPDSLAVVCGERTLTYAELDRRAEGVAAALAERGIGRGGFVPVLMERGPDVPVAMLGVLKAGAAFVPLDVQWPAARLRELLDDLGSRLVLVNGTNPHGAEELGRTLLDVAVVPPARGGVARAHPDVGPDDPIYAIYTSGSTGRPKAAVIPHRGITNRFGWMTDCFGPDAGEVVLQTTRHVYDSAVWQLFWPLTTGGRTVLLRSEDELAPGPLTALIGEQRVTMIDFVPSVFNVLVPQLTADRVRRELASLRVVVVGGEQITPGTTYLFMEHFPGVRVMNLYGPTEASIGCVCYEVTGSEGGRIPIGRPIANTHALVLDRHRRLVPVGVPGELYLSGACLGLGYLGDDERTRSAFVENPFPALGCARMYRTGDRVRWLPEGQLEYLGRVDQQVKLRGYRIEPGEIETALRDSPGVRDAVVMVRETPSGDGRLVAYLVPEDGAEIRTREVRRGLAERLPEHMVPGAFVVLEALPLTPNGKVDRRALPAPEQGWTEDEPYVPPRTPVEEVLVGIWAEVLRLDRVGVRDGFFGLGGHSLLGTRVMSRIREAFGVEVPLRALFEAPTVAGLAQRVDALLRDGAGVPAPPITPVGRDGPLPASFAQQRLWFIQQMDPESPAYNIPYALRLRGQLDVAALARSLGEVMRRHESLRTVFSRSEGGPVQVVLPAETCALPVVDLRSLPGAGRERELHGWVRREAGRPFDLERGSLVRIRLLRVADGEWGLVLVLHHTVGDGWSTGILAREVSALYDAFLRGGTPALPQLPVQYADYAVWQREWLRDEVLERQLSYWRTRLAGAPPLLEIPTDRPRPPVQGTRGAGRGFVVPPETTRALRELSRREGVTLFMVLLGAWQALLSRYSGEEDVSVGVPVAGRTRLEVENLIGLFVNTLVIRTDLSGEPGFRALLRGVREHTLGAYAHQDVPFEKVVEELQPVRSLSHTPLFQATFALQNVERSHLRLGEVAVEPLEHEGGTARFDLGLTIAEDGPRLAGVLSHRTELFDPATVDRMIGHFSALLTRAVADPDLPLSRVPLLSGTEGEQLRSECNGARVESPRICVHELFRAQAARTPGAVALELGSERLSYVELEERASRMARFLRTLGVGPEVRVGLCAERSVGMVVALLGILKAGGCYVPLDPGYPARRLEHLIRDAAVPVLLTQSHLAPSLPRAEAEVVCIDALGERIGEEPAEAPGVALAPENLAYVIYTSGSTGRPKGVAVPHGALSNQMQWMQRTFPLGPGERVLQKTPFGFDASVWEFWAPLLSGATLVLAPPQAHRDPAELARVVADARATVLQVVPPLLGALLEVRGLESAAALRRLFCGGDALPPGLAARVPRGVEVVNLYGPTEACIQTVAHRCRMEERGATVPIGRPVDNVRAYVLDRGGAPVPVGVGGELHLGGTQLARGYLGQPGLTAERFVPDPFSAEPGARMYRTGDRVRRLPEGELEFLGRLDQQVKLRGFRIEPGEIEAVLREHPGVREAVVVAREDAPGERRLAAYVVPGEGGTSAGELRSWLGERVPQHMVPSAFVVLDALPLTPSGKVDRRALPTPERSAAQGAHVAPRTSLELELARIWEDLLGAGPIGVRDDFFESGGHSLLAVRMIARIERQTGRRLPVTSLFAGGTIERLAMALRGEGLVEEVSPLVPIRPSGSRRPLFLVHPAGGNVMCYLPLSRHLDAEQPLYGLRSRGLHPGEDAHATVEAMAADYLDRVRSVQPRGPYRLGGWSMGGVIAFEMARQLHAQGDGVESLLLVDSALPSGAAVPDEGALLYGFALHLGLSPERLPSHAEKARALGPDARLRLLLEVVRAADAAPPDLDLASLRSLYGVYRSNVRALHGYRPGSYAGGLTLFRAADAPGRSGTRAADLGWGRLARGAVEVRQVPGDHFQVVREPYARTLAGELADHLNRIGPG